MRCQLEFTGRKDGERFIFRCAVCGEEVRGKRLDQPPKKQCGLAPATVQLAPPPRSGVGTELTAIFKELGISPKKSCQCATKAAQMDVWGIAGCGEHRGEILAWMKEAYDSSSLTECLTAGASALWQRKPKTLEALLDLAIERADARKFPRYVNINRIGWGDLAIFSYIQAGTAETKTPLIICATGERARHVRLLGLEPEEDVKKEVGGWTAFTAEMEHFHAGGTLGRLEFYADHYKVPRLFKKPTLTIPDEDMKFARSLGIDRSTVLFFPDSLSPNRVWPKIYWDMLADLLAPHGLRSLAFPIRGFEKHKNGLDVKPLVRVAACMKLAGLGIGNDSALINWTPLVDLPALCLMGPTNGLIFQHAPLIRPLTPQTKLKYAQEGGGEDCNGCNYHFKHNPFCSQTCMSLANLTPAEVAEAALAYHREVYG